MTGWEPHTVTLYEYDEMGRVARTVARSEPEWSDDDRDLMAGLWYVEQDECSGCGNPLSETTDQVTDEAFEVPLPRRCQACTAVMRAQALHEQHKPEFQQALRWSVRPR